MKNKKSVTKVRQDFIVLCLLPLVAALASWILPLNYLESMLLFFGLPSLYLSYRKPKAIKRCFLYALTFVAIAAIGDYFAIADKAWTVTTIFPFRLLGYIPLEDITWFFLVSYLILSYFELFFDHVPHRPLGKRMPWLYGMLAFVVVLMLASLVVRGEIFKISYFYFKSSLVLAVVPLIAFGLEFPRFLRVFLKTTPYFVALFFINEIVGLHKGYWTFPGRHFIGWVNLGAYRFPYEELIFYIILFSSVMIAYFEFFDDNRLRFRPLPLLKGKKA